MSAPVTLIDLHQQGHPRILAVYLLAGDEPALVDCGPASSLDRLREALAAAGLRVGDLRHLLLTHVHLDHAGAAGALVAENPELEVHVSRIGAEHLVDPRRLERSARRVFGDAFDRLWGPMLPVPAERIRLAEGEAAGLVCIPTPGHAKHHVAFLDADGACFVGDTAGVRIAPAPYVAAATPPPDIDVAAYERSLAAIEALRPRRLCLAHFGIADDPERHLALMRESLQRWSGWVRCGVDEAEFLARAEAELTGLEPDVVEAMRVAAPARPSYAGLRRWWEATADAGAVG